MKFLQLISFCILSLLITSQLVGQNVKIETTNLEIKENKLVIDYIFIKSKKNQKFNIWVEITTVSGKKLSTNSLSGDVGDNISVGETKQIIWDYNKDGVILNEEISVQVLADVVKTSGGSSGKAILLSALVPGLGITKLEGGKPYWLMGVVTYAALGTSIMLNNKAVTDYDAYLLETNEQTSNDLFNSSERNKQLSTTMAIAAGGIWVGSIIWTIIKAKNAGVSTANVYKKKKLFFSTGIDPRTKTAGINLKYRF